MTVSKEAKESAEESTSSTQESYDLDCQKRVELIDHRVKAEIIKEMKFKVQYQKSMSKMINDSKKVLKKLMKLNMDYQKLQ